MHRRTYLGLGLASIAGGTIYSTGAFDSVRAGRGVGLGATDDSTALLGITGLGSEQTLTVTNNTDNRSMTVELDAVESGIEYEIDGQVVPDPATVDLEPGESQKVYFETTDGREEVTIDFTAAIHTDGADHGSISLQRTVQIPQAEQIVLTPNVTSAGNSGFFDFEVANDGNVDVEIVAVAINDATVNNGDDPVEISEELEDETGGSSAPGPIAVLGREPVETDFVDFTTPVPLPINSTNDFRTRRLVTANGQNARYNNGGTLDLTFKLEDGSEALLEMEI